MTIRIAVPNKGRLEAPTQELLRKAGLQFEKTDRALSVPVANVDLELLFVRTEDVCELVADGVAAMGITGLDLLAESGSELDVLVELGFGRCRLVAAVPADSAITSLDELAEKRVATSHVRTTGAFFAAKNMPITTVPLRGSVEVAPKLDVADAIVDLVSSGSTLMVNGLRPIVTLLESEAVLVSDPQIDSPIVAQTATMLRAVVAGRRNRYVLMNAPGDRIEAIEEIIPGVDAPSIVPLAHNGMVAIHSVVPSADLWSVLPRLEAAGATGILVLPIEQMIP